MDFDIFNANPRKVLCVRNDNNVWGSPKNGHLLEIGKMYTGGDVDVSGWHTDVYLLEFPNIAFSSVLFEEIEQESECDV